MKQNNLFNRFFFNEVLKEEKEKYQKCKSLVGHFPELNERIEASKSLEGVLNLHKKAWGLGYQNNNLAPCEYGMFRTQDISKMTPEEVYLGNVYGLWTFPMPKWEDQKTQMYDKDISVYDIVLNQYKRVLHSNVKAIYKEAKTLVEEYEELNPPKNPYKLKDLLLIPSIIRGKCRSLCIPTINTSLLVFGSSKYKASDVLRNLMTNLWKILLTFL